MMPKIEIEYNPFCQAATLTIDGNVFDRPGSKINASLIGKPMCDWLRPRTSSYQQWEGFLAELMNEINDERFELIFCGLADDYAIFCEELSYQSDNVKELGFSPKIYRCQFQEKYAPEQIVSQLKSFQKKCPSSLPTQELYIMRDAINEVLSQSESLSIEEIRVIVDDFRNFLNKLCNEIKYSSKEQHQKLREMIHQLDDLY